MMKKITAFILTAILLVSCFAFATSAAETNLALDATYTFEREDGEALSFYGGTADDGRLNDGKYDVKESKDTTVCVGGTEKVFTATFTLKENSDITKIVLQNVIDSHHTLYQGKPASNRGIDADEIVVTVDGKKVDATVNKAENTAEGAAYSYAVTLTLAATGKTVAINIPVASGYDGFPAAFCCALDEIEIYGAAAAVVVDPSSADVTSDEPSDESSEEPVPPEVIPENTYIVDVVEGETEVVATVKLPNDSDVWSGNIVLQYDNAKLAVKSAVAGTIASTINDKFAENQIKASFAGAAAYPNDSTALVVTFTKTAEVGKADFAVPDYKLAAQSEKISDEESQEAYIRFTAYEAPVVEPSSETPVEPVSDTTSNTTSTPESGDTGIIWFALIAIIAAAGVVLAKKRA